MCAGGVGRGLASVSFLKSVLGSFYYWFREVLRGLSLFDRLLGGFGSVWAVFWVVFVDLDSCVQLLVLFAVVKPHRICCRSVLLINSKQRRTATYNQLETRYCKPITKHSPKT